MPAAGKVCLFNLTASWLNDLISLLAVAKAAAAAEATPIVSLLGRIALDK